MAEIRRTAGCLLFLALLLCMLPFSAAAEEEAASVTAEPAAVLSLNPAELTLVKGKSGRMTASVTGLPRGVRVSRYEWSSSDPGIVSCREGKIRAESAGSAEITCSAVFPDGTVLRARSTVTVEVPVRSLKFSEGELQVMEGDVVFPEVQVLPEDATRPEVLLSCPDDGILIPLEDGSFRAAAAGATVLTAVSEENPGKSARIKVTVTRRIGKTDRVLTFLSLPWESSHETCISLLKQSGFIAEEVRSSSSYSSSAWHWPENDLLFSRTGAWRMLPVVFSDRRTGAERASLNPRKTIGGFLPQVSTLVYLNGIGADGAVDPEITRLIGVYFSFDNRHEKGTVVFPGLLARLEAEYGEFSCFVSRYLDRYYPDLYQPLADRLSDAQVFDIQDLGDDLYLGEGVVCTLRGGDRTGIMLSLDTAGGVTLFYGRTDAEEMIRSLETALDAESAVLEDAGV